MTTTHSTREAWLQAAIALFRPWFDELGHPLPERIHVSIGFPRNDRKGKVIGQCWASVASADKGSHIFVHPLLSEELRILDVLLHELAHAADDCQNQHKGTFVKIIKPLGLIGKPTATTASDELKARLTAEILPALGDFPHSALTADELEAAGPKKQSTRMVKVECPSCGYLLRGAKKWLKTGLPTCACGTLMETDQPLDDPEDEPEDED
jgi:hypothetical protein